MNGARAAEAWSLRLGVVRVRRLLGIELAWSASVESRFDPPSCVTVGREPTCSIVLRENRLPACALLFDHVGDAFRLHRAPEMAGRVSFGGFFGPFERVHRAHARLGNAIALGKRACGVLEIGQWRLTFVHAPPRHVTDPAPSPEVLAALGPVPDGLWRCPRCRRSNANRLRFCLGCGDEVPR